FLQALEARVRLLVQDGDLAIDDVRREGKRGDRSSDLRVDRRRVVPAPVEQARVPGALLRGEDTVAVVLELPPPAGPRRGTVTQLREPELDPGRIDRASRRLQRRQTLPDLLHAVASLTQLLERQAGEDRLLREGVGVLGPRPGVGLLDEEPFLRVLLLAA